MAIFDPLSRYVTPHLEPFHTIDVRGRDVRALPVPEAPFQVAAGRHVLKPGQTLDLLANGYLNDPHAYWRITELNDAILPDALADVESLDIPSPLR
jgi:hypothetical protein